MSRTAIAVVSSCVACAVSLLHGGCRIGYELLPLASGGGGGSAGDAEGGSAPGGGVDAGGSEGAGAGAGPAAAGEGGASSSGGAGGQGGEDSSLAGVGGVAMGGQPPVGSLPPLPCDEPLVWATDFSSDPTALDDNGDGQPDWVIRGGAPFVTTELVSGVWRPATAQPLDTSPPVNFTGRTQARVRMRDTNQVAPSVPSSYGGALFWINLDYQAADFLAIYGSITTPDGSAHELGVFAHHAGPAQMLTGPHPVAAGAFVVLELDFEPTTGAVNAWLDGAPLTVALPVRQTMLNSDQWATVIAPQGTGEFDDLWVATCVP